MAKLTTKGRNIAHCIPCKLVEHETDEGGVVTLLLPRFRAKWMQWLQRGLKSPHIKVKLDEIGSAAWLLIDGKRTVLEIGQEMDTKLGEKIQPVNERLGLFLSALKKNKFVEWHYVEGSSNTPVEPR